MNSPKTSRCHDCCIWGAVISDQLCTHSLLVLQMGFFFRCGYAQSLVHDWAGGGVLQEHFLARFQLLFDGKRSERSFMEAGKNQLLLAGIGINITDRINAWNIGLEFFRVHADLSLVDI